MKRSLKDWKASFPSPSLCFLKNVEIGFTHHKLHSFKVHNSSVSNISTKAHNNHQYVTPEHPRHPQKETLCCPHSSSLSSWQPLISFPSLWMFLFLTFPIHGIAHHVGLRDWFLSSSMFSVLTHVITWIAVLVPSYSSTTSHCVARAQFVFPFIGRWTSGSFPLFGSRE